MSASVMHKIMHAYWVIMHNHLRQKVISGSDCHSMSFILIIYLGVSNYTTLFWAGDQNVDYTKSDGMPSTIPAALSIGLQVVY